MLPRTLFFDESGFTGYNLLDPDQPIFSVASAAIAEEQAAEILQSSFPRYQGAELKLSSLWGSRAHRRGLIAFASRLEGLQDFAYTYVINKRFGVLVKAIDFLIEPTVTNAGYDFYSDGFCWKYANYIYFGLTNFAPTELLDAFLVRYQAFSRAPSEETLGALQAWLTLAAGSTEEPIQMFFEQLGFGAMMFKENWNLPTFSGSDEMQTTTMVAIIAHWRQLYAEDFAVVHDASSNFLRRRELWDRITSPNVPDQRHRLGDGSTVQFPLRVVSTTAVDSRDSRAIQFCDLLAGLAARVFDPRLREEDRAFLDEVIEAGLKHIVFNGIRPEPIFPDQIPPRPLVGRDAVDQMTEIIFGAHHSAP